jgi:hypothetical protein
MRLAGAGGFEAADLSVAPAVVAEREDLASDRDAGDLGAATFGDPLLLVAQRTAARRGCAASISAQPNRCEPCLEIRPGPASPSEVPTVGVSAAYAHSWWAVGKRRTWPISAMISIAV